MSLNTSCDLETYFAKFYLYTDFFEDFPLLESKGIFNKDNYNYRNLWNILKNYIDEYQINSFKYKRIHDSKSKKTYTEFQLKNITDNIKNLYIYYYQAYNIETSASVLTISSDTEPFKLYIIKNNIVKQVSIIIETKITDIHKKLEPVFFHELSHVIWFNLSKTFSNLTDKDNILGLLLLKIFGCLSKDNLMYLNGDFDILTINKELLLIKYCAECLYYLNKSELSARLENIYYEIKTRDKLDNNIVKSLRIISDDFNKYCCLYNGANRIETLIENDKNLLQNIKNNEILSNIINIYFKDLRNRNIFTLLKLYKKRVIILLRKSIKLYKERYI